MLLLLLLGAGVSTPSTDGERAYAAISYRLVDSTALAFSLVNSSDVSISAVDDAEGSVS